MPMKVGLNTGRWNDQEFDLCPWRTCISEQINLIHFEFFFRKFRHVLLWMSSCGLQHKFSRIFLPSCCTQYWNFSGYYPIWIISITLEAFKCFLVRVDCNTYSLEYFLQDDVRGSDSFHPEIMCKYQNV